ncbi:hypothetical protein CFT12S02225_02660 [Campylobacter fetus subsp. testudinum]|uniref:Uncharacterized protein n=1 Tax=Campylobacter fetus subsp. testudinum TaxID=1507806 RepID=A0AAX0HCZ5_CAMFE|nr:hypothetical protein CFT12S02225_02660 [Campylobacter fetus subsp. testudinum]OCR93177.1 hypothetical protein CFT12S02263_02295 [Campylobacter fetus subsp. testudinum]
MPILKNTAVDQIQASILLSLLRPLYNEFNLNNPRFDTIGKLCTDLKAIFEFAKDDGIITINPAQNIRNKFLSRKAFKKNK